MSMPARMRSLLVLSAMLHVAFLCAWSVLRDPVSTADMRITMLSLSLTPAQSPAADDPAAEPVASRQSITDDVAERDREAESRPQKVADSSPLPVIPETTGADRDEDADVAGLDIARVDEQAAEPAVVDPLEFETQAFASAQASPASIFRNDAEEGSAGGVTPEQLTARIHEAVQPYFEYPLLARRKGWEGEVLLALRVEPDGRLRVLRILSSSGYRLLDHAAMEALARLERLPDARGLPRTGMETELPVIYRLLDPV